MVHESHLPKEAVHPKKNSGPYAGASSSSPITQARYERKPLEVRTCTLIKHTMAVRETINTQNMMQVRKHAAIAKGCEVVRATPTDPRRAVGQVRKPCHSARCVPPKSGYRSLMWFKTPSATSAGDRSVVSIQGYGSW